MSLIDIISYDCSDSKEIKNIYDEFPNEWKNKPFLRNILENTLDVKNMSEDDLLSCVDIYNFLCVDSEVFLRELLFKIKDMESIFTQIKVNDDECDDENDVWVCNHYQLNILMNNFFKTKTYLASDICKTKIMSKYLKSNNIRMLEYLENLDSYNSCCGINEALECGSKIETLEWLKENGYCFYSDTFNIAIKICNFEYMKWLKDNKCEFLTHVLNYRGNSLNIAIETGNLDVIRWVYENGCNFTCSNFEIAAKNGNLNIMKWLKENGCKMSDYTFKYALMNGSLDNVMWLIENECKIYLDSVAYARKKYDAVIAKRIEDEYNKQ